MSHIVFFLNNTATTEIYTLSLHDALPIYLERNGQVVPAIVSALRGHVEHVLDANNLLLDWCSDRVRDHFRAGSRIERSEEHTSELQSRQYLVCRLLLEKKKTPELSARHQT